MTIKCFFLLLLSFATGICVGQTQYEMNEAEAKKFSIAENEMNQVIRRVQSEYKTDTVFLENFQESQDLWMKFRDAEMKTIFPEREAGYYGSVHPMCWSIYKTKLTEEMIKKLRFWLTEYIEGDVCTTSQKWKLN